MNKLNKAHLMSSMLVTTAPLVVRMSNLSSNLKEEVRRAVSLSQVSGTRRRRVSVLQLTDTRFLDVLSIIAIRGTVVTFNRLL